VYLADGPPCYWSTIVSEKFTTITSFAAYSSIGTPALITACGVDTFEYTASIVSATLVHI